MEHETEKRQMDERNKDCVRQHEQQRLHVILTGCDMQITTGVLCTGAFNQPVSRLELAGKLGSLLLVLPLEVSDGKRDALLPIGSQAATLRGGCRAGR